MPCSTCPNRRLCKMMIEVAHLSFDGNLRGFLRSLKDGEEKEEEDGCGGGDGGGGGGGGGGGDDDDDQVGIETVKITEMMGVLMVNTFTMEEDDDQKM
eukprot:758323-Hanusia_phi.AAC.7